MNPQTFLAPCPEPDSFDATVWPTTTCIDMKIQPAA